MKTLIASSLLALSFSSFACPDLAGRYTRCQTQNDIITTPEYMVITNNLSTKTYTFVDKYEGDPEEVSVYTVGVQKTESDDEGGINTSLVSCNGNELLIDTTYASPEGFSMKSKGSASKVDGKLIMKMSAIANDGSSFEDMMICE